MPKAISIPDDLANWLHEEWLYCLSSIPYGQNLVEAWGQSAGWNVNQLKALENLSEEQRSFRAPFWKSFDRSKGGIPGYQGIVERCLQLVQAADEDHHGSSLENVAVATLPTNERYAAVYRPHIARDWNVIALDWGFICGLWGAAVCFAKIAPAARNADGSFTINFKPQRLAKAVSEGGDAVSDLLSKALVPCILMGLEPPIPLPLEEDLTRVVIVGSVFNGLVFSVVAHEYAHIRLGHLSSVNTELTRRHQMEHEADGLALAYALKNPWRILGWMEDWSSCVMAVAGQSLVLSFLGMLETGDRMLSELGHERRLSQTHPPAMQRLMGIQFLLNNVLKIDDQVRTRINEFQQGFVAFGDEMWNGSVRKIIGLLSHRVPRQGSPERVRPRSADLKFL